MLASARQTKILNLVVMAANIYQIQHDVAVQDIRDFGYDRQQGKTYNFLAILLKITELSFFSIKIKVRNTTRSQVLRGTHSERRTRYQRCRDVFTRKKEYG